MTVAEVIKKVHITCNLIDHYEDLRDLGSSNEPYDELVDILKDHVEMLRNLEVNI